MLAAGVGLLLVYLLLGAAGEPRAGSGADVGGKLAELEVAVRDDRCDLDVGYWAAAWDPDGDHHQLVNTERRGDRFQQGTSLAFQCASMPAREAMGPLGALLLPALGGVAAAAAAARITWLLSRSRARGWASFVLVGATTPVAFYALDFWEHAPAVGAGAWAVALLIDEPSRGRGALAGVVAGVAVVLRAELLLYLVVAAGLVVAVPAMRRRWFGSPVAVAAGACVAGAIVVLNQVAEVVVLDGDAARSARAGALTGQAGSDAGQRALDAAVTTVGLFADGGWLAALVGLLSVAGVGALALLAAGARQRALPMLAALGASLYAARMATGPGFMPGALAAAPLAVAGLALRGERSPGRTLVVGTAVLGAASVWVFSWSGRLVAQWGGRYLLLSGVLLAAVALAAPRLQLRRGAGALLVGLSVAVGAYGMVWHVQRTSRIAEVADRIGRFGDEVVLVALDDNLGRELGGWYGNQRWLRAAGDLPSALDVVRRSGGEHLVLVGVDARPTRPAIEGWRAVATDAVPWFGDETVHLVEYERR